MAGALPDGPRVLVELGHHGVMAMRALGPTGWIATHTLGEKLGTLRRYSFLERQLLIAFC